MGTHLGLFGKNHAQVVPKSCQHSAGQGTAKEPPRATKSNMSCTKMTFPWHHFSQGAPPRNRQGTARCKRQGNPCPKQAPTIEIHDQKMHMLGTHFWMCVPKMPRSTFDKQDPLIVDQFSFQSISISISISNSNSNSNSIT